MARDLQQLRPLTIIPGFVGSAAGSCLVCQGNTQVICTASYAQEVPRFLRGQGRGWLTAEYAMLPASTGTRKAREFGKRDGRGVEISRLIGRALRQAVDMSRCPDLTITIDCDVLQADGGTRCAAITGGYVALVLAIHKLYNLGIVSESPLVRQIAAVSVGLVDDEQVLDLCYRQDSRAQADINVVMDGAGHFVDLNASGEKRPFTADELTGLLKMAQGGISQIMAEQTRALGDAMAMLSPRRKLVLATHNQHKVDELVAMLGHRYEVLSLKDLCCCQDIEETGDSFRENAAIKAETVTKRTGLMALADDSGLTVEALKGAPGIYSARYRDSAPDGFVKTDSVDQDNNRLLLESLSGVTDRDAAFVCCLALSKPGSETVFFEGRLAGTILEAPKGQGGFGYDPLFGMADGRSLAEYQPEEKNAVSHRALAMQAFLKALDAPEGEDAP